MRAHHTLRLLVTVALLGCGRTTIEEHADDASATVTVHVVAAQRGPIESRLSVIGETAALRTVRLAAPVAGRIVALGVQPGDRLGPGVIAARVLPLESEAAVHGLEVLSGAGALDETDRASAQRLAQRVARHEITLAAPFESIVAERLHNPGEQVAANDTLLELYDPQSLIVIAHVPLEAAPAIQTGQAVAIEIGSTRVDGRVDGLSTAVTADTLTVPVRISLSAALHPPLLHAAVQCRILLARHEDTVLIPRTALATSSAGDEAVVMVVTGTHAQRRAVHLGLRDATQVEVIDGLDADERVVADGGFALPEDAMLSIVAD